MQFVVNIEGDDLPDLKELVGDIQLALEHSADLESYSFNVEELDEIDHYNSEVDKYNSEVDKCNSEIDDCSGVVKVIFPGFEGDNQDLADNVYAILSDFLADGAFKVRAMDDFQNPPAGTN